MKKNYPLKACPWCGITPKFNMSTPLDQTWLPIIQCNNPDCPVQPKTKYIPIRKKQRGDCLTMMIKIDKIVSRWNSGNLPYNNEGFRLDFELIARHFEEGTIGLPGYTQAWPSDSVCK
jgi:hypothetical protein